MVVTAEQHQVVELSRAALRPVHDVVGVDEAVVLASRELAAPVAGDQCPSHRWRYRPRSPADAHGLLKSSIRDPDPVLFLEHKKVYRLVTEEVPDGDHLVPIGPASVRREGKNLSCFAWGLMTHYCLEAAQQLEEDGVSVEVVDLRTLAPLDRDAILASVRKTGKAMVVHEDNLTGGFGAEVAAIISEHAFDSLDGPVVRVAAPDIPAMPFNTPQEDFFMPSPSKIAEAMRKLAAY